MDLFFELSNLAPICEDCHKKVFSAYKRGIEPEMIFPVEKRVHLNFIDSKDRSDDKP